VEPRILIEHGNFRRNARSILKTQYARAFTEAIRTLELAENPARLGHRKHEDLEVIGYNIGSDVRLLYQVDYKNHVIYLLAVGSHKIYK